MTMRALVVEHLAPEYAGCVVKEVDTPKPGPGEVRVKVRAASVNFPDLLMTRGEYQHKPPLPFIPGLEMAGVVAKLGEGVDRWKVGDAVAGGARIGGFSEMALTQAAGLRAKPENFSFGQAAGFGAAYLTAYVSLVRRAQVEPGEWVLAHGAAGGVGLACVDLARVLGCRVIAASASDAKLKVIEDEYAPDATVNVTRGFRERVKELTGGRGADVIYDPVGGDLAQDCMSAINWNGRYLVIGFPAGIPEIATNRLLIKGAAAVGVFWGAFVAREPKVNAQNIQQLYAWVASGQLKPYVSKTYPLAQAAQALRDMMERKVTGKVVLTT